MKHPRPTLSRRCPQPRAVGPSTPNRSRLAAHSHRVTCRRRPELTKASFPRTVVVCGRGSPRRTGTQKHGRVDVGTLAFAGGTKCRKIEVESDDIAVSRLFVRSCFPKCGRQVWILGAGPECETASWDPDVVSDCWDAQVPTACRRRLEHVPRVQASARTRADRAQASAGSSESAGLSGETPPRRRDAGLADHRR